MKKTPKISVIMPVYNVEKYLANCIESVLAQTFTDFELICVNDGATDASAQILSDYAAKDERIIVITQQNKGLSGARNEGFKRARGEWIYFVDSDDAIHPQLLEIAYLTAEKNKAQMVCFGYLRNATADRVYRKEDIENLPHEITDNPLKRLLKKRKFRLHFNVWTKFFKRELIEDIQFVEGITFEDYPFTYRVAAKYPHTVLLKEKLYCYAYNPQSISRRQYTPKYIRDHQKGLEDIYVDYRKNNLANELKYIKKTLVPKSLKNQYKQCVKLNQPELWQAFAEELADLRQKGLLCWRGHNLWRYLQYKKLIEKYAAENGSLKMVKIMGGLGNQMFQYAFGQALKNAQNGKVLYDASWFAKKHKKKVAGREYMLDLFGLKPEFASQSAARRFAGKSKLYNLFGPKIKRVIDAGWGAFRPEILHLKGNVYYDGYFQNEEYFADIAAQIRRDFTFPQIAEDDAFNRHWLQKIKACENAVCIHIRRGDYLNLSGWVLPLSYYQKAVKYVARQVKNPTFFVFGSECDDYIKNEFDIGYPFEVVGEENARNHEDWKDMMLMATCKHAIIANSTFSWWAAWLGEDNNAERIVAAPSPFVENDNIIPEHWVKIER